MSHKLKHKNERRGLKSWKVSNRHPWRIMKDRQHPLLFSFAERGSINRPIFIDIECTDGYSGNRINCVPDIKSINTLSNLDYIQIRSLAEINKVCGSIGPLLPVTFDVDDIKRAQQERRSVKQEMKLMENEWLQKMIPLTDGDKSVLHDLMKYKHISVGSSTEANCNGVVIVVSNKNQPGYWYLKISDKLEFVRDVLEASVITNPDLLDMGSINFPIISFEGAIFDRVDFLVNLIHWKVLSVAYKNKELYSNMFPGVEVIYDRFDVTVQAYTFSNGELDPLFGCIAVECETTEEEKEKWREEHPLAQ